MAVSPLAVAKRVCEQSDWTVTNLSLQKIMYMAHMAYMGENNGARLIGASFEAWDYGPVEPKSYHRVKIFGDRPIQDIFVSVPSLQGMPEAEIIDDACLHLLDKRPGELVEMTHWQKGAWAKNYVPGARGIVIPDNDIVAEYKARVGQA